MKAPVAAKNEKRETKPAEPELLRVLDDDGSAAGALDPGLPEADLRCTARCQPHLRRADARFRGPPHGFYGTATGQEASTIGTVPAEGRD